MYTGFIFDSSFGLTAKSNTTYTGVTYHSPRPHHTHPHPHRLLTSNICHHSGAFITISEPTLPRHCHPKSRVYMRAHSWRCTFYRCWQMCDDKHPLLQYHTEQFRCPRNAQHAVFLFPNLTAQLKRDIVFLPPKAETDLTFLVCSSFVFFPCLALLQGHSRSCVLSFRGGLWFSPGLVSCPPVFPLRWKL